MKVALDTNVLVYANSFDDPPRQAAAIEIIARLPRDKVVVPLRVLAELVQVLTRKMKWTAADASREALLIATSFDIAETSLAAFFNAMNLAAAHQVPIYDALIVATAAEAGCEVLLTEDLHEGFAWNGVQVLSPFRVPRHPAIEALLEPAGPTDGAPSHR